MTNISSAQLAELGYRTDTLTTRDGREFRILFFKHASLALEIDGHWIYLDPVNDFADYERLPKADLILVSHHHYDHFELEAVYKLMQPSTQLVSDKSTSEILSDHGVSSTTVRARQRITPWEGLEIEILPAYNYSEGRTQFHPKERDDVGYILSFGGTRLYLSGDGEDTPEMKSIKDIDIAFLSVNQPYTMTVDQAVSAIRAIRPKIFYPYHYGQTEETTNLERLQSEIGDLCEVRIRGME